MSIRKALSLLIAILLTVTALIACTNNPAGPIADTTGKASADTSGGAETQKPPETGYGNIPAGKRFDCKEFRIATYIGGNIDIYWASFFDVDEPDESDRLQAAAHRRNGEIEEKLGCTITCDELWPWSGNKEGKFYFMQLAADGDTIYDLYFLESYIAVSDFIIDDLLYDAATLPYIDWDADYYHHTFNETYRLRDKQFIFCSDMTYPCQNAQRMYVNLDILNDLNYDTNYVYDLVNNGTWTVENMFRMMEGQYEDVNKDDVMDANDYYGYAGTPGSGLGIFTGAGLKGSYITDSGWEFDYATDKAVRVFDTIERFVKMPELYNTEWNQTIFQDGRALFRSSGSELREIHNWGVDINIGVVPQPKYDDQQDRYYSFASGGMLYVPADIDDPDFVGAMIEAMSYGSQKHLVPAFYENFVQYRVLQDDQSRENWRKMLSDWSMFEFAYLIAPNEDIRYYGPVLNSIYKLVNDGSNTYASNWAEIEDVMKLVCNQFYKKFMAKT
ncbi:MAG: hypothetical protein J6Z80_02800 [Clostridia bacterium]|nr:hypothetical protein [Clostridia bacterium]